MLTRKNVAFQWNFKKQNIWTFHVVVFSTIQVAFNMEYSLYEQSY